MITPSRRSTWQGSKWIRPDKRWAIYLRDGVACVYCGATAEDDLLTLDHRVPVELGGDNNERNLVTACRACNSSKRDLTTREWLRLLRDRGTDTEGMARRIGRLVRKPLDRAAARRLLASR